MQDDTRQGLLGERTRVAADAESRRGRSVQVAANSRVLMVCVAAEAADFLATLAEVGQDGVQNYQLEESGNQVGLDSDHEAIGWVHSRSGREIQGLAVGQWTVFWHRAVYRDW